MSADGRYPYDYTEGVSLTCTCCGGELHHTQGENCAYGQVPYPFDNGIGLCRECGGADEPIADGDDEETIKKKLGTIQARFYESRFRKMRGTLNEANRQEWDGLPFWQKAHLIGEAVTEGQMG